MKNRMREFRTSGSVRGEGDNVLAYSAFIKDIYCLLRLKYPLIYQTTENTAATTLFSMNKAWKRCMSADRVGSGMFGMAS